VKTFLIAHTNKDGETGAAQASVSASTETVALRRFGVDHPDRKVVAIGQKP
jgi:hypothetical protein